MPIQNGDAPLQAIVQRGTRVYTRDIGGEEVLVCESPDVPNAGWVAWSLSSAHSVNLVVEAAEKTSMFGTITVTGAFGDPLFKTLMSLISDTARLEGVDPQITHNVTDEDMRNVLAGRIIKKD
jgi:hypothetical protein